MNLQSKFCFAATKARFQTTKARFEFNDSYLALIKVF